MPVGASVAGVLASTAPMPGLGSLVVSTHWTFICSEADLHSVWKCAETVAVPPKLPDAVKSPVASMLPAAGGSTSQVAPVNGAVLPPAATP